MKYNVGDLFITHHKHGRFTGILLEENELCDLYIIMWTTQNKTTYETRYSKAKLNLCLIGKYYEHYPVYI